MQKQKSGVFSTTQLLFGAAAAAVTITAAQFGAIRQAWQERQLARAQAEMLTQINGNPLQYAGYAEDSARQMLAPRQIGPLQNRRHTNDIGLAHLDDNHITVLRNKQEMDAVFRQCAAESTHCPSGVAGFRNMIAVARRVQDPLTQAGLVNGWVNTAIRYDNPEAGQGEWRRTLVEALQDGKGVCDEQAQLKFYALQQIGFKPQDTRFVLAALVQGKKRTGAHSFVLARINGNNWALDNQTADEPPPGKPVPEASQFGLFTANGRIYPDARHANSAQAKLPDIGAREVVPKQAMTYLTATPYQGVNDNEVAPFYVGAAPQQGKTKTRPRSAAVAAFDLMTALDKETPETAASARMVLQVALFAYRPAQAKRPSTASAPVR